MDQIIHLATQVSTPLALAGLIASFLFFVFRQLIAKAAFGQLGKSQSVVVIRLIVDRMFVLSLVAMVLGFLGFVLSRVHTGQPGGIQDSHGTTEAAQGTTPDRAPSIVIDRVKTR